MARTADPVRLVAAARAGDRRALAQLLTLLETPEGPALDALAELFPATGGAHVVGITGPPGAGKSTLTDGLIRVGRAAGIEIAVLAVDPTSPYTGGAILGDRIRMQDHAGDPGVYIRSMASRGHLGGLAAATPRAVMALDAVGFPLIVVETVGVGQAEVDVAGNADTTVVVVNPGWGDSIQAAKAGLLEAGDVFVVNKADRAGADAAARDLDQMLDLGYRDDWRPPVLRTIATDGTGVTELWDAIRSHRARLDGSGRLVAIREDRLRRELDAAITDLVLRRLRDGSAAGRYAGIAADVVARRVDPWNAARAAVAAAEEAVPPA